MVDKAKGWNERSEDKVEGGSTGNRLPYTEQGGRVQSSRVECQSVIPNHDTRNVRICSCVIFSAFLPAMTDRTLFDFDPLPALKLPYN